MTSPTGAVRQARRRDPERRQRILTAAADLVAERGYHDVGMAEIGAAVGITGSGIYRHFHAKSAVLVAMFDQVIDDLSRQASATVAGGNEPIEVLRELIADHVRFVATRAPLARVYHYEIANLPDEDRHRLRRKQRLYLEEWVHVLARERPEVADGELRALVHAAIGAIQSALFFRSGLADGQLAPLMQAGAEAVLFATPAAGVPAAAAAGPTPTTLSKEP